MVRRQTTFSVTGQVAAEDLVRDVVETVHEERRAVCVPLEETCHAGLSFPHEIGSQVEAAVGIEAELYQLAHIEVSRHQVIYVPA